MVVTYAHTGGTNVTGSDRKKRRYTQLTDGNLRIEDYPAKRPKVSTEYQQMMDAIDAHNFWHPVCKVDNAFGKGARHAKQERPYLH